MANLYLARQPIFDADLTVRGYELLYRNAPGQERPDADQMTSTVLVNALLEIGLDNVVGERTAFINVTRNFLVNDSEVPLNPGRTVLEVLEHVAPDDDVIAGCQRLRDEGFRIALDDFEYTEASARLLPIADIVKIDLLAMGEDAVGDARRQVPRVAGAARRGEGGDALAAQALPRARLRPLPGLPAARGRSPCSSAASTRPGCRSSSCSACSSTPTSTCRPSSASYGWTSASAIACCASPATARPTACSARCAPSARQW